MITQKPDRGGRQTFTRDGEQWTVTFQSHKGAGKAAERMSVRHTIPRGRLAFRLVAVADDGSEHVDFMGNPVGTRNSVYSRPSSSIKEFRFQVRPYHWVEFQNISLQPGQKTDVQVVSLKEF